MKWHTPTLMFLLLGCIPQCVIAQSIAINTDGSVANPSSILDVKSTSKGILIPRMTKAEKNAIVAPVAGLMVYQTSPDSTGFQFYDGSRWNWVSSMNALDTVAWKAGGNMGTDTARHFIGTKDPMPIRFRQNNQWLGQLNANSQNYFIGKASGQKITTGTSNTAFGDSSLASISSQFENTAFGNKALKKNINIWNTAFGASALENNTMGSGNTAFGYQSQMNTRLGNGNTSMGYLALSTDTLGFWNTAFGSYALNLGRNHQFNTGIGYASFWQSGQGPNAFASEGSYNTGLGAASGFNCTSCFSNTLIGVASGYNILSGFGNTAVGAYALNLGRRGIGHVAIGYFALGEDTSNAINANVAVGRSSLFNNISGYGNTAIGDYAGVNNESGRFNTYLGMNTEANDLSNTTTIGAYAKADTSNAMILGSINGVNNATADVRVGIGTTKPKHSLHVVNTNPDDAGWRQGIMIENTSPVATSGEAAISFKNSILPADRQWIIGMNQNPLLAFNYGPSFIAANIRMVIDSSGNVGIGNNTPSNKLHVSKGSSGGPFHASSMAIFEDNATGYLQLSNPAASDAGILSGSNLTTIRSAIIMSSDSSMSFRTGGNNTRIKLQTDGNIGINTNSPNSKLEVNGSFANPIQIITTGATLDEFDHTVIISSTVGAAALTVTLPAASVCARREYVIVNQNATAKTVSTYRDFTNSNVTTVPANGSITLQSNGTLWYRIR